jgi:HNH endonuclease
MDNETRQQVRDRANNRCEYCLAHQDDEPFFRYQVEHIRARQHDGSDELENLALACPHCNRHKGPNLSGIDPQDGTTVPLFHPRRQEWAEHFAMDGAVVTGKTPIGRATVRVLSLNDPVRVEVRAEVLRRIDRRRKR